MRIIERTEPIKHWLVEDWEQAGVANGFCGSSLNLRAPDSQRLFSSRFFAGAGRVLLLSQEHTTRIISLLSPADLSGESQRAAADGWILNRELSKSAGVRILIGIQTADCIPVLVAARGTPFVAALHCGWRGAVGGILKHALTELIDLGAEKTLIEIAIGPGAQACCYEIGEDTRLEFETALKSRSCGADDEEILSVVNGRVSASISGLLKLQAREEGVLERNINDCSLCTICNNSFFSYRRQKKQAGRQLSFIG